MSAENADNKLTEAIRVEAVHELTTAVEMVNHCLAQLDTTQIWWRPDESMNSIGNLILHICGNVRQWIVTGLGNEPDRRERQREFDQRDPLSADELRGHLNSTVAAARSTLANTTSDILLSDRTIQGFGVNGLRAVFHSVSHFRGHVQEIVHLTRQQLGDAYQFDFVPRGTAQGQSDA